MAVQARSALHLDAAELQAELRPERVDVDPEADPRRSVRRRDGAREREIVGQRDLEIAGLTVHDRDRDAVCRQDLGLVGEDLRPVGAGIQRVCEQRASRSLRRLRRTQSVARDDAGDPAVLHAPQRIGDRHDGNGGAMFARGGGHRIDQ